MSMKSPCKFHAKSTGSYATLQTSLWRHPDAPQCLADYVEDVRTTEQHLPDATSITIQHGVGFQKLTLLGKSLQVVRMTWQHVRTLSSISEYSSVPFEHRNEDRLNSRPSRPDVDLIRIELRSFWKAIAEVRTLDNQSLNLNNFRFSVSL
jgi:hypothetical protein